MEGVGNSSKLWIQRFLVGVKLLAHSYCKRWWWIPWGKHGGLLSGCIAFWHFALWQLLPFLCMSCWLEWAFASCINEKPSFYVYISLIWNFLCVCSDLDHPGLAKLIAAHARPPNYLMFFDFFEPPNLAEKIHVEEWIPSTQQVVAIASDLGQCLLHILWYSISK